MKRFAKQFRHAAVQLPEIPHSAHITRREAGHIRVLFFQKFRSGHRCALFRAGADDLSDLAVQLHLRQIRVHGSFQCGKHCAVIHSFSNIHLRLYGIILFTADNALVVIFNEVHGKLACILDGLAVDKVLPEGLLHQHITAVFFMDPYQELANAIVLQAVKDYRMTDDEQELKEIERFFRSNWFGVLTKVDPNLLITNLRKEKKTYDY